MKYVSACTRSLYICIGLTMIVTRADALGQSRDCDAEASVIATSPAPPSKKVQLKAHVNLASKINRQYDFVMIGDSLVHSWPAGEIRRLFKSDNFYNLGISGDTTEGVLWRLADRRLATLNPRVIVLLIGTNNLSLGHDGCAITLGISKIIEDINALWRSPKILVIQLLQRRDIHDDLEDERLHANRDINLLSSRFRNVRSINLDNFVSGENYYRPDGVHFTADGYAALTTALLAHPDLFQLSANNR